MEILSCHLAHDELHVNVMLLVHSGTDAHVLERQETFERMAVINQYRNSAITEAGSLG